MISSLNSGFCFLTIRVPFEIVVLIQNPGILDYDMELNNTLPVLRGLIKSHSIAGIFLKGSKPYKLIVFLLLEQSELCFNGI